MAGPGAGERQGARCSGTLRAVPWGREAGHVVVQDAGGCFALHVADAIIEQAVSPAGEPRDTMRFERVSAIEVPGHAQQLFDLAALARAMSMAGAPTGRAMCRVRRVQNV